MSPPLITVDRIPAGAQRRLGSRNEQAVRQRIEKLGWLLDSAVPIPFTSVRVGADAIAGLIPGIGDIVSKGLSAWLIWEARGLGVPKVALVRMAGNVALDAVISVIPLIGNIWDIFFRANERNLRLLASALPWVRAQMSRKKPPTWS